MVDKHYALSRAKAIALLFNFGDGIEEITGTPFGYLYVPFAGYIQSAVVAADAAPTLFDVDILVCALDDFPSGLTSIVGSSPPTLAGVSKVEDAVLSGWTKDFVAKSMFKFIVLDTDTVKAVTAALSVFRY